MTHDPLEAALAAKGPHYVPRTRHLHADGRPKYLNRLILEASPYLLQHAHNPVDWYPWGDEAFAKARELGRPVFLSIGYATCHWCHVMEEESFEDEAIARALNDRFVCVKVDREERPDVDGVYMAVVQALTGRGGWPMSVFLNPSREPFFAGTYFPPRAGARGAKQGFLEITQALATAFANDPTAIANDAHRIVEHVRSAIGAPPSDAPADARALDAARAFAEQRFDRTNGGPRGQPKFPSSFPTRFLMRYAQRKGDEAARSMATTTLTRMRNGGIDDQVGGGFHRYSVDARWLVPHFEKMLYDNALLAAAYLESGDPALVAVARTTLDYLLREMRSPEGTFYSATDADSATPTGERDEGWFFTWTPSELAEVLGEEDAKLAAAYFDVTEAGNFEGRTVLSVPRPAETVATDLALESSVLLSRIAHAKPKLYASRESRPPPLRDEKVLVAWNSLVVSALARAAIVSGESRYADAAVNATRALVAPFKSRGSLPRSIVPGGGKGNGFLDDHAFLAAALLDVFELTSDVVHLDDAIALMDVLDAEFRDDAHGGYFLVGEKAEDAEGLFAREKPLHDGAVPSGNSVAAMTSLRLATMTGDERHRVRADAILGAFASLLPERLPALEHFLLAVDFATMLPAEIAIVLPGDARDGSDASSGALAPAARPFLEVLSPVALARSVLVVTNERDLEGPLGDRLPWAKGKRAVDGRPTAYVCEGGTCRAPSHDPVVVAETVDARR